MKLLDRQGQEETMSMKISIMKKSNILLNLLVVLLVFSQLNYCSNAIPSTRTQRMLQADVNLKDLSYHQTTAGDPSVKEFSNSRMDLELNDYPGLGANNRHTPKPPSKK